MHVFSTNLSSCVFYYQLSILFYFLKLWSWYSVFSSYKEGTFFEKEKIWFCPFCLLIFVGSLEFSVNSSNKNLSQRLESLCGVSWWLGDCIIQEMIKKKILVITEDCSIICCNYNFDSFVYSKQILTAISLCQKTAKEEIIQTCISRRL